MPSSVGENQTRRKLKAGELVLFMGVNQMRTPNIAMMAAARGLTGCTSTPSTTRLRWPSPDQARTP